MKQEEPKNIHPAERAAELLKNHSKQEAIDMIEFGISVVKKLNVWTHEPEGRNSLFLEGLDLLEMLRIAKEHTVTNNA